MSEISHFLEDRPVDRERQKEQREKKIMGPSDLHEPVLYCTVYSIHCLSSKDDVMLAAAVAAAHDVVA